MVKTKRKKERKIEATWGSFCFSGWKLALAFPLYLSVIVFVCTDEKRK